MSSELTEQQHRVLACLLEAEQPQSVEQVAARTELDQAQVAAVGVEAESRGWLTITVRERQELSRPAGEAEPPAGELPERRFLPELARAGSLPMREAAERAAALGVALNEVLRWGSQRGWLVKRGGQIGITDAGRAALGTTAADERTLELLRERGTLFLDELEAHDIAPHEAQSLLVKRAGLVRFKTRTVRSLALTEAGRAVLAGPLSVRRQKSQLTSEDIVSGAWRQIELKPYDVTLAADVAVPAKRHPLQRILDEARRAFLEMGFTEVVSPMVETAFWDFDALFQPQDHPARDMQDTFYMARPREGRLPDPEVVERVRRTHEDGWETGSRGWGYRWRPERARQMVLRTHTTASSIRQLALDPKPPRKVFCVGRVFRNENITYKHLPEFTQVDGIIIDENASFAMLLATLREFYRKMGFTKLRFKPEFFPYTEPSAGVVGYLESRGRWFELGGSGLFRPEVTEPLGCTVPVCAWGLGLERFAMTRFGLQDIRTLYLSDLDWLKEVPLCQ